ncbi:MAG: EutN/CcmL family microcompartment protein [Thermoanaerobaculales bacterium]|nr:EutN/CcmL family microcompartment protein [Thermoanaerobaculales bacterium]
MKLGRVTGTVVSTISAPFFDGRRLLTVDLLDPAGTPTGAYLICVDAVDAGAGETVLVLDEGSSARQILKSDNAPVRAVIVGIIDEITLEEE